MNKERVSNEIGKKGIWKVTTDKKREKNGNHSAQQAVWHNGGCASLESTTKQQIKWLVASVGSPPLRQAAGRYRQCGDSA